MAIATDARVRYTKDVLRKALLQLLLHKDIETITVTELCEMAQLNRATFYRHYANQYDLLESVEQEMLEEIKTATTHAETIDALILQMFQMLYENRDVWVVLMSSHADLRQVDRIYAFFQEYFRASITSKEAETRYRFMVYGFSGIFRDWIATGMKESPETMARQLISCRRRLLNLEK